ncbi:regulatory protein RecX [Veillonella ratti]|uniref:regulatory protein RecX n=1 Tax=Veillonella ratti TaxID=103892 RepID=UPI000F8DE7B2|nr:regulatory protein RecX [Veillonella ratti]
MALTKEYTLTTAMDQAMRFLAPRFLSRLELTQKLQRKGVPADLIHQVLERLEDLDYINDERLAHDALQLYISEAKYSVQFIRNKLYQRGLAIGNELSRYDETEPALKLVVRHFIGVDAATEAEWFDNTWPLEARVEYKKVFNYLKNRGFSAGTIRNICDRVARYE